MHYDCGVLNCGGGKCVHKMTDELCPCCGSSLVLVMTNGVIFCANKCGCDYDRMPHGTPDIGFVESKLN
jgi:hypothetical protein